MAIKFAQQIQRSEVDNKSYVQQIVDNLEGSWKNLKRKRDRVLAERSRQSGAGPGRKEIEGFRLNRNTG